ncbi:MAG: universal stress protein [Phycisphaerae bacterium]|nr:universal stress protein [Phycisphaerae bacterium]
MSIRFSNILFPTDFSDVSMQAAPYAVELARTFDAQLHALYILDEAYQYWSGMGPESIPVGPPPEELLELARERMLDFKAKFLSDVKREALVHIGVGRPFAEIIAFAREHEIDLIVMATHGRGAFAHALLGSTTEKVVRKAECPVLTVRGKDESAD